MAKRKEVIEVSPSGGIRTVIHYLNDQRELVDESQATRIEIIEYNEKDEPILRTYGTIEEPNGEELLA